MDYDALLSQVMELLQREKRVPYRSLKRRFDIDDDYIEDLKIDIIKAKQLAIDEDGEILVWTGTTDSAPTPIPAPPTPEPVMPPTTEPERDPASYTPPHLAEKILTSRSALEGERKQVTVLFCDLQNSTPLAEKIGPENMHALLNRFFERALQEIHRYEGTINQFLGDGFMALFGAPIAHEDHARRAVLAAIGLQRTLKESNPGEPYGVECAFRIGVDSGLVVVASIGDNLRMDYTAVGDTTNLAARLQTQSEPGEILVSETTARLVEGYIRLEVLEPVEVKGKTEPVPVFKVVGTLSRRSPIVSRSERTLSQFVGRERELTVLHELFAQVESGQGQVVGIVGEAGQGKSRVLYEFRQRLVDKHVTYLEGRCLSYGSASPYHPVIDIIRQNCGIAETDNSEAIREKVGAALQEVGMDAEASVPYLLQLLGVREGTESIRVLTPEAVRTRTFETLRQMSLNGAQRRPLIFEVEDLHWVDRTSEAYMASLVESLPGASILLLTTYRPGYQPPWLGKSYATQISLHRLASDDALNIVHATRQGEALSDPLAQTIIDKADGNPFFLEELTRAVIEQRDFQAGMTVPDTIQGVLSARIDRLPEEAKRLLQTASVLGREFSLTLLQALWDSPASLEPLLLELKQLEFLFERTGEERLLVFKHALTQQVGYDSLLTTRRQALHASASQALEALYENRLEEAYDRLAYHYANADHAAKAVEYLTLAAERAARGYAYPEAVASLHEALVHAERLPAEERDERVLDLVIRQGECFFWSGRHRELVALFLGQQERLRRLRNPVVTGVYYYWLAMAYMFLGEREHAAQSAQRAQEEAQRAQHAQTLGMAYYVSGAEDFFAGRLLQSVEHSQQAVALLEETTDSLQRGTAHYILALSYFFLGAFASALEVATTLAAIGRASGDQRLQSQAASLIGWIYANRIEGQESIAACQQAMEYAPDGYETALNLGLLGYAYLENGDLTQAIPVLESAVQEANRYRSRQVQNQFKTYLGEAYLAHSQIDKAHALACQGFDLAQSIQHPWGLGLAQRALGRIALTNGDLSEAEFYLQNALATFDAIQARYDLARTHLDLASLAHTQGNQDTATTHLSTAYTWFKKLQVPKWAERTEQLAHEYGVTLTEVELEELTEGSS